MKSIKELLRANESNLRLDLCKIANGSEKDVVVALENIINSYNNIDDYKEELTANEMSMFRAVTKLIQTSMGIAGTLFKPTNHMPIEAQENPNKKSLLGIDSISNTQWGVLGTTVAGFVAGLHPSWVTVPMMLVVGAACFMLPQREPAKVKYCVAQDTPKQIDVNSIIDRIYAIAEQVDDVMRVYSSHIDDLKAECNRHSTATLSNNYGYLVERLRDLYSVTQEEQADALKSLRRTLVNYGYKILEYTEENKSYFVTRESEYVSQLYVESLAVMEHDRCILMGTVFIPSNK